MKWTSRIVRLLLSIGAMGLVLTSVVFGEENNAYMQKGVADFKSGNYDQAIADFTAVIQSNPQSALAYFQRAYVYMTTGNDGQAISDLTRALQINPKFGDAYIRRSFVYVMMDDPDRAIADLNQDIQLNPNSTAGYFQRAYAYMMKGNYDVAIGDCDHAIQIDPAFEGGYVRKAMAYTLKGDYAKAIEGLNQDLQQFPRDAVAYRRLAWLLATCPQAPFRDGKKAIEAATAAADLTLWKSSTVLDTLAAAYAESRDFPNAVKWEKEALTGKESKETMDAEKIRLALYEAYQPFHAQKYKPEFEVKVD